jgi:hemoglobin-like flavoprotein
VIAIAPVCVTGTSIMDYSLGDTPADVPHRSSANRQALELRRTWELVTPFADEVAELFYARLFELDPSLRPLFRGDPATQRQKLMDMLGLLVDHADRPDELHSMLAALGARHVSYGVRVDHYDTVGEALLWTLEDGLGLLHTVERRNAWAATWQVFRAAMLPPASASRASVVDAERRSLTTDPVSPEVPPHHER